MTRLNDEEANDSPLKSLRALNDMLASNHSTSLTNWQAKRYDPTAVDGVRKELIKDIVKSIHVHLSAAQPGNLNSKARWNWLKRRFVPSRVYPAQNRRDPTMNSDEGAAFARQHSAPT